MSASDATSDMGWRERAEENDWTEDEREAAEVLHESQPGDMVLFADRSKPMAVAESGVDEDGHHYLEVEKPRADGTYRVTEGYSPSGSPKYSSDIGRANDLRWTERKSEPRGLSETHYQSLVARQSENAQDRFVRKDMEEWSDAVREVVLQWAEDVAFQRWDGYPKQRGQDNGWEDGDVVIIFESVVKHSDYEGYDEEDTIRAKAEESLYNDIYEYGRSEAAERLIQSGTDYRDIVVQEAQRSLDRYENKSYVNPRTAVRDTISQWIDDREEPVFDAIIEHGTDRFDLQEYDTYDTEYERKRDRAFDILSHDVWEEVQEIRRERGEHDPTIRGLTYTNYQDLVDVLAKDTASLYDGQGYLRTTATDVVNSWANRVEEEAWDGHRHRVYADGDVDDIFSSATIHAEADPVVWNPFAGDKARKMAVKAVVPEVVDRAENIIDENQPLSEPTPADDYIENNLGLSDVSMEDFNQSDSEAVKQTIDSVVESLDEDVVGWTFVDEIVGHGGVVPEATNDWILVDYGIIREGEKMRKLAWFSRDTGDVLTLSGMANAEPMELQNADEPYDVFHVAYHEYEAEQPEPLLSDVTLEEALNYVYDRLDADRADFEVIETQDETYIADSVTDEDINAGGALDALVPNVPFGTEDLMTLASAKSNRLGKEIEFWGPELAKISAYAIMVWSPKWLGDRLDGVRVEPNIHKHHGVGINISKKFGAGPNDAGVGGNADINLNIRNSTFSNLADRFAPTVMREGIGEGDIGKGVVSRGASFVQEWHAPTKHYADDAVPKILNANLGKMSLSELQELADKTDRDYRDYQYNDKEQLVDTLYGYAKNAEQVTVYDDDTVYDIREAAIGDEDVDYEDADLDDVTIPKLKRLAADADREFSDETMANPDQLRSKLYGYAKYADMEGEENTFAQKFVEGIVSEYAGSILGLFSVLQSSHETTVEQEMRRDFLADFHGKPPEEVDIESDWENLSDDVRSDYAEYIDEQVEDMTLEDIEEMDTSISGMVMRGLDAETIVDAAEFWDVDEWLDTQFSKDFRYDEETPSFEEWEMERFGPGEAAGPEEEARRRARFHKEVVASEETPDPLEEEGISAARQDAIQNQDDEMDADSQGDYFLGGVPNHVEDSFESVADRFRGNEDADNADNDERTP